MSTNANPKAVRPKSLPIKGHRFLIVGGASLVGSASAELLLREGAAEVTILDNFFQGSAENIKHLSGDTRLETVRADVMRLPQLIEATRGVDGVLHLAAVMSLTMDRDPWMGLDVNIRGTQNVIEACCVNGVKKLVFASSTAVYGYGPGIVGDLVETHALPLGRHAHGGDHLRRDQDHRRAAPAAMPMPSADSTTSRCAMPRSTASASTIVPPTRSTSSRRTTACARACARA